MMGRIKKKIDEILLKKPTLVIGKMNDEETKKLEKHLHLIKKMEEKREKESKKDGNKADN
jgi:hypothetical protein